MSKRRSAKLYVDDIWDSIGKIEKYSKGYKFEDFTKDTKTVDAIIRNFTILGESIKNLPKEIKQKYPDIPWREIMGMRNKIVHEYFAVDEEILWKSVTEDLPPFKKQIRKLKKDLKI